MNIARSKLKLELVQNELKHPEFHSAMQLRTFRKFVAKTKRKLKLLMGKSVAPPLFKHHIR